MTRGVLRSFTLALAALAASCAGASSATHTERANETEVVDLASSSDDTTRTDVTTTTETASDTTSSEPPPPPPPCGGPCTVGTVCGDRPGYECTCDSIPDVNCGGAYRPTGPPTIAWVCRPLDGATDRGDGCPYAPPRERARCTSTSRCAYPEDRCGLQGQAATCVGGRWHVEPYMMPPPP